MSIHDSCFKYPFVGLREYCEEGNTSNTLIFINDLEGISLLRLSNLLNAESTKIEILYQKLYDRVLDEFFIDLLTSMSEVNIHSMHEMYYPIGYLGYGTGYIADVLTFTLKYRYTDAFYRYSVRDISFITSDVGTVVDINVVESFGIVKTITHTTTLGLNTIIVDYSSSSSFDVVIDFKGITILNGNINNRKKCIEYYTCCFNDLYVDIDHDGITLDQKDAGVLLNISRNCDIFAILCMFKQVLATPFRYRLGIAILEEALNSDNINRLTTSHRDSIISLLGNWVGTVDVVTGRNLEGKYPIFLNKAIKHMSKELLKIKSRCINCDGLKYVKEVY